MDRLEIPGTDVQGLGRLAELLGNLPESRSDAARLLKDLAPQIDQMALDTTGLMARFDSSLAALIQADPDLTTDFLTMVRALLTESDTEELEAVLNGLSTAHGSAGSDASRAFEGAMSRLRSAGQISARVEAEIRVRLKARADGNAAAEEADPLILDLAGDGISTTGADRGVLFDIDGDGRKDRTSFVSGDDAFLALDRNGNGRIDSGNELFGDQNGSANGFEELARYDSNNDGRIDSDDPVYDRLRLFRDLNGNGVSEVGELSGLGQSGVKAIRLAYRGTDERLTSGDRLAQTGEFVRKDGSTGKAADAVVRYLDLQA